MFQLVEEFVPELAFSSTGRLLLLNAEPGAGMFCLELDHHVSLFGDFCAPLCCRTLRSVRTLVWVVDERLEHWTMVDVGVGTRAPGVPDAVQTLPRPKPRHTYIVPLGRLIG